MFETSKWTIDVSNACRQPSCLALSRRDKIEIQKPIEFSMDSQYQLY